MKAEPPRYYVLDDAGEPLGIDDALVWGEWFQNSEARILARAGDEDSGVWVSTVFLGLDHQFGVGPPVLWETIVFFSGRVREDDTAPGMRRYTSRAAAIAGHQETCAEVRAWLETRVHDEGRNDRGE